MNGGTGVSPEDRLGIILGWQARLTPLSREQAVLPAEPTQSNQTVEVRLPKYETGLLHLKRAGLTLGGIACAVVTLGLLPFSAIGSGLIIKGMGGVFGRGRQNLKFMKAGYLVAPQLRGLSDCISRFQSAGMSLRRFDAINSIIKDPQKFQTMNTRDVFKDLSAKDLHKVIGQLEGKPQLTSILKVAQESLVKAEENEAFKLKHPGAELLEEL